jgi:hypothetical protein
VINEFGDNFDRFIRITTAFNTTTRAITGITVFRDADCQWTSIFLGLGPDGDPRNTDKNIDVPAGTTVLTSQQLNRLSQRGISTIEDFLALQITAG